MMRMEIEFNRNKIEAEQLVQVNELYKNIEKVIKDFGLNIIDSGIYTDNSGEQDYTNFLSIMMWLDRSEWFKRYVSRWTWFNDYDGFIQNASPEDLLENI